MKLELYIHVSETLTLRCELRTAPPPVRRLVNGGQKRGGKRVTEEPNFGTPREQVTMRSESEDVREVSLGLASQRRLRGWEQNVSYPESYGLWSETVSLRPTPYTGIRDTAHSITLRSRQMDVRNGVTHPQLSQEQVTSRMLWVGRIAQEAKAIGKADGYADVGTVIR